MHVRNRVLAAVFAAGLAALGAAGMVYHGTPPAHHAALTYDAASHGMPYGAAAPRPIYHA